MDVPQVCAARGTEIELAPAFGNSGTRFRVFGQPGVPRDLLEKVADAAKVHELTGLAPRVALYIPWDKVDDYGALAAHADSLGVHLGTVNSNTFQDDEYKLGSPPTRDKGVRRRAIEHHVERIDVMDRTGSRDRQDLAGRRDELHPRSGRHPGAAGVAAQGRAPRDLRLPRRRPASGAGVQVLRTGVLPHRCPRLGPRSRTSASWDPRRVCPPRHRPPRAGDEHRVHRRPAAGGQKFGSFDFNSRFYADDDLIVGAADPFQLFRILFEVVRGGGYGVCPCLHAGPVPQHREEDPRPDPVGAQRPGDDRLALLVDREALAAAQSEGDVLGAHEVVTDAFYTDVRPASRLAPAARSPATRCAPTPSPATRSRSRRAGSAAPRPAVSVTAAADAPAYRLTVSVPPGALRDALGPLPDHVELLLEAVDRMPAGEPASTSSCGAEDRPPGIG